MLALFVLESSPLPAVLGKKARFALVVFVVFWYYQTLKLFSCGIGVWFLKGHKLKDPKYDVKFVAEGARNIGVGLVIAGVVGASITNAMLAGSLISFFGLFTFLMSFKMIKDDE